MRDLSRLLRPRSVAVIGGGVWCENVVQQCRAIGFRGAIWPVHPTRAEIAGVPVFAGLAALPSAPDAVFIGVNRTLTVQLVAQLSLSQALRPVLLLWHFLTTPMFMPHLATQIAIATADRYQ